jgi:hypothetical protein
MIKKLVLHFPDGSVRTFDSTTHRFTITDRKIVVRNEQGEEEAFLGMPLAAPQIQALERSRRVVVDAIARRRPILFG